MTPDEVAFRDGGDGDPTERLLTELGVTLVHPSIAASVSKLPYHDLGIKEFDLSVLFKALSELGGKPVSLHRRRARLLLWREIDRLLQSAILEQKQAEAGISLHRSGST